jgi:hypothetical protein
MHALAHASGNLTATENTSIHPARSIALSLPKSDRMKCHSNSNKMRHGSIPGYIAVVRQNAGKLAMVGETRVLANLRLRHPNLPDLEPSLSAKRRRAPRRPKP